VYISSENRCACWGISGHDISIRCVCLDYKRSLPKENKRFIQKGDVCLQKPDGT